MKKIVARVVRWFRRWFSSSPPVAQPRLRCDFKPCGEDAFAFIAWGRNREQQQANACQKHIDEAWLAAQNQIAVGLCFWIQDKPKTSGERRRFNAVGVTVQE